MIFNGKRVLHAGCGGQSLPAWFGGCIETRLDIDDRHSPDIVADMRELDGVEGGFDIIYTSHALEHLYPHEVVPTLSGFRRILNEGGTVISVVPNLRGIEPTDTIVYESPSGPITGLDMYYGLTSVLADMPYMAHHTGFVRGTLEAAYRDAGYSRVAVTEDTAFNLIGAGMA